MLSPTDASNIKVGPPREVADQSDLFIDPSRWLVNLAR
jgi:hypothetical protein